MLKHHIRPFRRRKQTLALFLAALLVVALAAALLNGLRPPPRLSAQDDWPPGDHERSMEYDGRTRTMWLHIPPGYDGSEPLPLVIGLHGGVGNGRQFAETAQLDDALDALTMIGVYPEGTGAVQTWNAGHCCGYAQRRDVDDVGFIAALIAELQTILNIDARRVYVTGMSNGAILAHHVGAALAGQVAAIAPVAGTVGGRLDDGKPVILPPPPTEPVSVIAFNGMQDTSMKYDGGHSEGLARDPVHLPVSETIAFWVEHNGCDPAPVHESLHAGNILRDVYACAEGTEVVLYTIVDGGHSWPGGLQPRPRADTPTQDISATELMLAFFLAHPKGEQGASMLE